MRPARLGSTRPADPCEEEHEPRLGAPLSDAEGGRTVEHALAQALVRVAQEIPAYAALVGRFLTAGKCLRARLVLLAAGILERAPTPRAVRLATAIELIHAGALCHDDVVDHSDVRRGAPTVRSALGDRRAVELGLFLLLRGAALLAIEPIAIRTAVAHAVHRIVRGQTDELADLFVGATSPEHYLARARDKTGALYGLAGRLGGFAGRLPSELADAVESFASDLGLGFQLADDLRDLLGGPGLGREAGTDLREGVYTLPVLLTLAGRCEGAPELRRMLAGPWSANTVHECVTLLQRNGAAAGTAHVAHTTIERGVQALRVCPDTEVVRRLVELARGACAISPPPSTVLAVHVPTGAPVLSLATHVLLNEHRRWLSSAYAAPSWSQGLGDALLDLTAGIDGSRSDAFRVALIDLLVGDVFTLLPLLRPVDAVWVANVLTQRIGERIRIDA